MIGEQFQTAALVVTGGAVAFALAVALWAWRITESARRAHEEWKRKLATHESKIERFESVLGGFPGMVLVWEDDEPDPEANWGAPRNYGLPSALMAMLRFAAVADGENVNARILDALADFEARDALGHETTLRQRMAELRQSGRDFSLLISGPGGRFVEADGRPCGRRMVLWLTDATAKGLESSAETMRQEEVRAEIARDPAAFRDLAAKAPFPIARLSSGGRLIWANAAYLEAVEASDLEQAANDDAMLDEGVKTQVRKALAGGHRIDEIRAIAVGGERRHLSISVYPVSGGAAVVALDVSREHVAREALERHVRAQDDALNHIADAVAIFNAEKTLVFHNRAFRDLFGLEESWLDTRPNHGRLLDGLRERDALPEQADYAAWRASELARYASIDEGFDAETWSLPDGRLISVGRLRHPMGGMLLIFRDLTEAMTLKAQFLRQLQVQGATLDKLDEGVAVFGSDGRLRLHNAAFEQMWRLPSEALLGEVGFDEIAEACLRLYHDRDVWAAMKLRITGYDPEGRQPIAGEMKRSDGTMLTFNHRPLPDGSSVISFNDVTAARELEDALAARVAAQEQASKVKSTFVGHVSYQLRTPMTTILGYAEILSMTAQPKLSEREAEQLGSVLSAAYDLNKRVEDILDIAAIEADTLELDLATFDALDALRSAINLIEAEADRKGVKVSVESGSDIGVLHADPRRIKQVVYNLLLNALEHSASGGHIAIGAEREGEAVVLWIEDDGEGIPLHEQGAVFETFKTGKRSSGAGLGLALVRALIELHGGAVDLQSEPGVGTRVTLLLPQARDDDDGEASAGLENPVGAT